MPLSPSEPPQVPHPTWSDTDRAEAFSDGVFAIVLTLLVLDLRIPEVEPGNLLRDLLLQWPHYLAYITSFFYVAVIWLNHKAAFDHLRYMSRSLHWANIGILLTTSLLPFPTAVVSMTIDQGNSFDSKVAVSLYALAGALVCLSWGAFFGYLKRHHDLLHTDRKWYLDRETTRAWAGLALYAVAGLASWVTSPTTGLIVFLLLPIFYGITSHGISSDTDAGAG